MVFLSDLVAYIPPILSYPIPSAQVALLSSLVLTLMRFADDAKRRKRGRPPKTPRTSGEFSSVVHPDQPQSTQTSPAHPQPSQVKSEAPARQVTGTPTQSSPPAPSKQTPTKASVKALPTVRDHTSDQLGPEGDEYIPREFDEAGEKKVDELGYPQGGRTFKCRTFTVPERGQKLFMLATECARVLNYRDSYLLFNKNRSLFKIIATQPEKDHLISQEILPYSYRSRQIAIVTAKSMFRQFGSRVIVHGRRVRDDYWESKAKKQGFTEDDLAGEKRPGGAKSREAAAAESQLQALPTFAQGDIVYSNGPVFDGIRPHQLPPGLAATLGPSSVMNVATAKDYSSIPRPQHEMTGAPYPDRSQPSSAAEIMNQAAQAAEFNKSLNRSRSYRSKGLQEFWNKPREPAATTPQTQSAEPVATDTAASQPYASPRFAGSDIPSNHPPSLVPQQSHHPTPTHMNAPSYALPQNSIQSPIRRLNSMQASMRDPSQYQSQQGLHRASPNVSLGHGHQTPSHQPSPFGYPSSSHQQQPPLWGGPPPQPQASPGLSRMHTPQFSPPIQNTQGQQMPSPVQSHHPSQSPHPPQQMHPSQILQHHSSASSMPGQQSYGSGLPGMQGGQPGYQGMGGARQMYPGGQNPPQYMQQHSQQPHPGGMQGWPAVSQGQQGGWSGY
jgi:Chromatin remodelling complex Rsc7/Swp82 subunit